LDLILKLLRIRLFLKEPFVCLKVRARTGIHPKMLQVAPKAGLTKPLGKAFFLKKAPHRFGKGLNIERIEEKPSDPFFDDFWVPPTPCRNDGLLKGHGLQKDVAKGLGPRAKHHAINGVVQTP